MHRSHKKIVASVSLLLVAALVVTTISISNIHTVSAQPSFQGIQTIVADNTVDTPFSVVELVPDTDMAAFGYLAKGNEPVGGIDAATGKAVLWQDAVKLLSGTDARVKWMEDKYASLKEICGADNALTYTKYEETYVVTEEEASEWTKVTLTTEDSLEAGTAGYSMTDAGEGKGAFILSESYALSDEAGNGDYDENADYYAYSDEGGYYSLAFKAIEGSKSAETLDTLKTLVGDNDAYKVVSSYVYKNADEFEAFQSKAANQKCAIYAIPRSDISASYTYVGLADEVKLSKDTDSGSTTDPDTGSESGSTEGSGTGATDGSSTGTESGSSTTEGGSTGTGSETTEGGSTGTGSGTEGGTTEETGTDAGSESSSTDGTDTDAGSQGSSKDGTDTDAGSESGTTDGGSTAAENTETGIVGDTKTTAGTETGGSTEGTGESGEGTGSTDNSSDTSLVLDFNTYWYYSVVFEYVTTDQLETGKTYYSLIPSKTVFNRNKDAQYGAVLNVAQPYVENKGKGNFKSTSAPMYRYVGEGNGKYTLVKASDKMLDYKVELPYYYYKGGFASNELFKNQVFNQDSTDSNMYFDVTTVTPASFETYLEEKSVSQINLLVVSKSASFATGESVKAFDSSNDISEKTVEAVIKQVYDSAVYMPVIADYSIIASEVNASGKLTKEARFGTDTKVTNVQRLTALLCASNFSSLVADVSSFDLSTVNWKNLTFSQDTDHHYVNKNIYVIPGNNDGEVPFILSDISKTFIDGNSDTAFENAAKGTGFEELASYIVNENFIRKAESMGTATSYELFDYKISKAIAIEYCISYLQKREQTVKHEISVLDIEPRQTNSGYDTTLQTTIKEWFTKAGYKLDSLTVTTVPMAEFIGRIDDLADYDMIYFGLNTDYYNIKDGQTVYNDTDMNGLIYSNVGDISVVNSEGSNTKTWKWSYSGLLESDYLHTFNYTTGLKRTSVITAESLFKSNKKAVLNEGNRTETFRLSGNDLTKQKYNEIIDYIKGGFPVVFADDFMNGTDVNDNKIDNCTYIYELVKDQIANENVMTKADAEANTAKLYRYISLNKPVVTVSGLKTTADKAYVTLDSSKISFSFQIENLSSADGEAEFDCIFYLDNNADGRFSSTESVVATDLTITQNGKRIKPKDGHYSLKAGSNITYSLSYYLPDSYIGIIPWKLKISQNGNDYRYDSEQGYFYKKSTSGKQVINILQITTKNGALSGTTLNMQQAMNKKNSTFYKLVSSLEDFTLNIKTITGDQYTNSYTEENGVAYVTVNNSKVRLDSFDMLVLGFADVYSLENGNNNCYKGLQDYIDSGKPVLCTHDTTSTSNDSTATYWGYDFNTLLRNYVGMDRYGILSNNALKIGLELDSTSTANACFVEGSGRSQKTYYVVKNTDGTYSYTNDSNASGIVTVRDLFEDAVAYAKDNDTDIAYKPKSNKTKIVKQNQGMTDLSLMAQYCNTASNRTRDYVNYGSNSKLSTSSETITTTAVRVNKGQITTYPFTIGDTLTVSNTHYQYYQLDMNEDEDDDGESDIVVWYTLSGASSGYSLYTTAEKDVRNNYYIYTKGNITYSGVGHDKVTSEQELKLYINTMIAAYSTGLNTPTVSIRQGSDEDAPSVDTIYLSYDAAQNVILEQELGNSQAQSKQKFYFTVKDSNLIKNMRSKEEFVDFYIEVTKAEYDAKKSSDSSYIEHDGTYLKKQNWTVCAADGSALSTTNNEDGIQNGWYDGSTGKYHLVSGTTYCVELDMNSLISAASYNGQQFKGSTKTIKIYLGAYTKITYNNSASTVTDTDISYYGFDVRQLELVDLD